MLKAVEVFLNARRLSGGDLASGLAPLLEMLGLKRLETLQHSQRVSGFSRLIGLEMRISQVAAAVYVINREEIHRSGMTSVADLLRLAPGLSVARLDGSTWAVSSRGFNGRFANKLLVLIDGRSIYTPIFSGVYWDMSMPLLDDIDRIEVVRGPGASVWGANADSGVINIITKTAGQLKGGSVTTGAGTVDRAFEQVRFGGKAAEGIDYRGYLSANDRAGSPIGGGQSAHDGWSDAQGGFRIDGTTLNGGW
jgi:iron complex outermembrane receptor protein